MHLNAHDFATSLGFLFVQHGMEKKQQKTHELSIYFMEGLEILNECVLIFLSLSCSLVMCYELKK